MLNHLTSCIYCDIIGSINSFVLERNLRPMNIPNSLLTVQDVSSILKVTPQYVRKIIKEKKLVADRFGSQWMISSEKLSEYITSYEIVIEPDDHERISSDIPEIVALSFFSGAMGLDIGMMNGGIKAVLACEFNKECRMTIQKNNPDIALIGDINKYSCDEILRLAKIPKDRNIDVMFGGPPCQAFSTAGSRRGFDDERGNVFLRYIDIAEEIKPSYIVIENVRGLLSAEYDYGSPNTKIKGGALLLILDRLEKMGYSVSFELYNAANFGAPQNRERIVIIAKRGNEKVEYLSPTHSNIKEYGLLPWRTLSDALAILPKETKHNYIDFPEKRLRFYRMLNEGQYWKDLPPNLQKEAMGNNIHLGGGRTGFYRRLSFDKPSPTLVTDPTMPATDLCHPTENRPLSVEEYACIQEFPLNWTIYGSIKEQYRQLGNAVPIKLGEAIARTILADMKGEKLKQIKGFKFSRYKNTNDVSWRKDMALKLSKMQSKDSNFEQLTLFDN